MRSLFAPRGIILVWAILTASIGLGTQLRSVAFEIRRAQPEVVVTQVYSGISAIPPQAINAFFDAVHFNPAAVIVSVGILQIQTIHLIFLLGLAVLVIIIRFYQRAIKSPGFADDFVMLGLSYLVFRIVLGIWSRTDASIQPIQDSVLAFLMIALIVVLTSRGGGADDSKIFWRGVIEIYIILLLIFPDRMIPATTATLEALASFGEALGSSAGFVLWSLIGLALGTWLLYGLGSKPHKATGAVLEDLRKKVDEEFEKAKK